MLQCGSMAIILHPVILPSHLLLVLHMKFLAPESTDIFIPSHHSALRKSRNKKSYKGISQSMSHRILNPYSTSKLKVKIHLVFNYGKGMAKVVSSIYLGFPNINGPRFSL